MAEVMKNHRNFQGYQKYSKKLSFTEKLTNHEDKKIEIKTQ